MPLPRIPRLTATDLGRIVASGQLPEIGGVLHTLRREMQAICARLSSQTATETVQDFAWLTEANARLEDDWKTYCEAVKQARTKH